MLENRKVKNTERKKNVKNERQCFGRYSCKTRQ